MATDVERLVVAMEARTAAFERALKRANSTANQRATVIERRFRQMNKNLSASFGNLQSIAVKAFAVIGGVAGGKALLDSALRIENSLKVAGLAGQELEKVYQKLFISAQKNAAPLETLVTLYGRVATVQKELGVTGEQVLSFTDNIALALRVAGADAQAASGALLQLSQALGSGVVRAQEFNSMLDGALPIVQAAAAGIKEAGGSVAKLRELVNDGKISSEAFFRGFEAGAPMLEQAVSGAVLTIDQRLTNLKTALIDAAKRFNNSTKAAETFGGGIDTLSTAINNFDVEGFVSDLDKIISKFAQAEAAAQGFAQSLGASLGLDNIGKWITGGQAEASYLGGALRIRSTKVIRERVGQAFDNIEQSVDENLSRALKEKYKNSTALTQARVTLKEDTPQITPISIEDYSTGGDNNNSGGGSSRNTGRSTSKLNDYEREVAHLNKRVEAMNAETAALASLNPLINDYGYALEKARTTQELLTAAKRAGLEVTPQLREQINELAEGYAMAVVQAGQLAETQDQIREASEFFKSTMMDAFQSMLPAIETGNAALNKFLNTLIDVVLQATLLGKGPLAGIFGGSGFGGLLGSIFPFAKGGIAANGRPQPIKTFAKGGVSRSAAIFGEAGPEAAVPLPDGRRIPVDLRMNGRSASGGTETIHVVLQDDSGRMAQIADQRIQTATGTIVQISVQQSAKTVKAGFSSMLADAQARER